jgi:type II secretory pathway pseudopilin PulG
MVEIMIVVVIIGILALALFPSMRGYMSRSRDTSRVLYIRDITNSLSSYAADRDVYPNAGEYQMEN